LLGLNEQLVLSMEQEADKAIAKRSIPGSVVLFLLLSISAFISDIESDIPIFYYTLLSLSILTIVIHLFLVRSLEQQTDESITRWKIKFSLIVLFSSINWSIFSSWALIQYGIEISTLEYLLFTAGIASGAASALFVWKRLAQMYLTILLIPIIIVMETQIADPDSIILGLGFALYFIFLFYQIYRSNDEYWIALLNNRKLEIQTQELTEANRIKTEFLSNMSHELRTPLNAILGYGQLLELDIKDDNQKTQVKEILNAGNHLLTMINELLDLSKIEAGKIEVTMQNCQLNNIIEECAVLIKPLAEANSIQIINNTEHGPSYFAYVDVLRFKQVMLNLLSNAIKYNCDNGSITINIEQVNSKRLRIEVSDTGQGLSQEQQERLFTRFTRLEGHKNIEGTGIGLSISKQIIELMDGAIGVESEEGKGSKFWIEVAVGSETE